uniref:NAD(P)/FAD-dependent oxidoreductase n=1 Tax=Anaerococcus mediterraneensis TaxID=1870984 RepID=UPI000930E8BD|nr:FAD-dependent oxidoreductase [Anaerococcus mediterraneensis]
MYDYLIIGNGIAGLSAAEEIRKNDEKGSILIVSDEKENTYWRTRLSELIAQDFTDEEILVKKESWYKDKNIEVKLDTHAEKIDNDKKEVTLACGTVLEYGKLLIATGAHAFVPPIKNADAEGVFAIRSANDLKEFKNYLADKKKLIIIGGGILGLEAANSINKLGIEITIVEAFDYLLARQLDKDLSKKLEKSLNEAGMKTLTGVTSDEILIKDGKVCGLRLSDGTELEADAIMIQAGVRSNLDVAKDSGLETDRGILVGENLQVEGEDIYVAGDVAQIGNFSIGLWTASMEMGKIAGANMTGDNKLYEKPKPFSTLILENVKLFSAGQNSGEGIEEVKKENGDKIYKLFKNGDKFVGGILWNDISYQTCVKNIVFEGMDPSETKLGKEIFGL